MHISSAQGLILFYDDCLFTCAVYKHIFKRTARLSDDGGLGTRARRVSECGLGHAGFRIWDFGNEKFHCGSFVVTVYHQGQGQH